MYLSGLYPPPGRRCSRSDAFRFRETHNIALPLAGGLVGLQQYLGGWSFPEENARFEAAGRFGNEPQRPRSLRAAAGGVPPSADAGGLDQGGRGRSGISEAGR
jgi:hypothetical protein